ncbi:MAG: HAD family hydrolase [Moraxellaceae bacterium]|nr:MAG: HAD family hydrolase [Moraxellaceae bacterium]
MRLAIFDLDNTLIAGDSDHSWGEFLVQKNLVDAKTYAEANDRFYQQYQAATLDIQEYLRFSLAPLTGYSLDDLAVLHAEFMRDFIEPMMLPKAKELLQNHRSQGDYLLIITATNSFVTHPIAKHLGVDDILASDAEILNGRYTGKGIGTPCFQGGKVIRLQEWLKEKKYNLDDAYFYSDSINDLPLLEKVPNPVAVDADERLSKAAQERGWKQISLRD